jgi:ATP-dependent RNA helicase SUPV3L1/SUV3
MPPVAAVLGPTNTGKTHRAIERMLEHASGMIGLPLRLLAREVYDRVTARVGEAAVALVTGEEKRIPERPRYWVCTVEAMPAPESVPGGVDFVAVDEIQLAGHRERGHVFTDRLLYARGRQETFLLGADTMRPLMRRLVPEATIEARPRLSTLTGAGSLALGRLPPRTAVVAFSATRVYELAERLRARRGGAAVVLGALSPRARNAQVALYQAGEVDYMVATDAIGMGLNMDVDCVAFADLHKFDGRRVRPLDEAELAQIAGRAGRNRDDGRFATLDPLPALPPAVTRAIERHRFPAQERVYWRSHELDTSSIPALLASLRRRRAPDAALVLAEDVEDLRALEELGRRPEIVARATSPERVALLWQVCQVPDYRQLHLDDHFQLLAALYTQLTGPKERVADDWIDRRVARLDDSSGDVAALLSRMAFIRTWTYVTHHTRWVEDAEQWQGRTRAIEDRLSDALHLELVRRFVDARARARTRRAGGRAATSAAQAAPPAPAAPPTFAEMLRAHVAPAAPAPEVPGELGEADQWVDELVDAPHARFALDGDRIVVARSGPGAGPRASAPEPDAPAREPASGAALARMVGGVDLLHPEIVVIAERPLGAGARLRLGRRLLAWTRDLVAELMAPLRPGATATFSAAARGLLYQLEQSLGTIFAREARPQIRALTDEDRRALRRIRVRVGRHVVFVPPLLALPALRARVALCTAYLGPGVRLVPPPVGAVSLRPDPALPPDAYAAIGYPVFGARAIRADLADGIGARLLGGAAPADVAGRLGCTVSEVASVRAAFTEGPGRQARRAVAS